MNDRCQINFFFNNKSQIGSSINFIGEFDPGSGRTLAACLTHASRTEIDEACFVDLSGERVSNA